MNDETRTREAAGSPQQRTSILQALNARFFGVIAALVTLSDDESSGKIPYESLADQFTRPDRREDVESTLRRYLKRKFRATAASAVDLGEALFSAGVPWCSGWWMLYAAGRYDAYVYVTAHMISRVAPSASPEMFEVLWGMITGANELCLSTELDNVPSVARLHREHSFPIGVANKIYCEAWPTEQSSQRSNLNFLRRDTAKAQYRRIDLIRSELSRAYDEFRANVSSTEQKDRYFDFPDRHIQAAVAHAKSSRLTLDHKEFMVRHHLKAWLESLAPSRYRLSLPEYELASITEVCSPFHDTAFDISDPRMMESLSRISAPWFYDRDTP